MKFVNDGTIAGLVFLDLKRKNRFYMPVLAKVSFLTIFLLECVCTQQALKVVASFFFSSAESPLSEVYGIIQRFVNQSLSE